MSPLPLKPLFIWFERFVFLGLWSFWAYCLCTALMLTWMRFQPHESIVDKVYANTLVECPVCGHRMKRNEIGRAKE